MEVDHDHAAQLFPRLHTALFSCDPVEFKALLIAADTQRQLPVLLARKNGHGHTLLISAVVNGELAMAQALLDAGADSESVTSSGATSLYLAAEKGYGAIVKLLVERGANIDFAMANTCNTPLMRAVFVGHADVALYLIAQGAACGRGTVNHFDCSTADMAAMGDDWVIFRALMERGAFAGEGLSPLAVAATHGALTIIAACLADPVLSQPARQEPACTELLAVCKNDAARAVILSWKSQQAIEAVFAAEGGFAQSGAPPQKKWCVL